jgi:hypothetical protein
MNSPFTICCEFHTTRRRDGQQHLSSGPAPEPPKGKIPRISRLMALAIHCDELLRTGQVANQSALAEYAHVTPARLTQILTLLNLAPAIQEELLFPPRTMEGRGEIQEKGVRRIAMELDWRRQRECWQVLRQPAVSIQ